MNKDSIIEIEWLSDTDDCDTCGLSWAEGANVHLNNTPLLELVPSAYCRGTIHYDEAEVYRRILVALGYKIIDGKEDIQVIGERTLS